MSFTEAKRREIKNYILRKIDDDDKALITKTSDAFGISATSVKRYLDAEIDTGHIARDDRNKCGYSLIFNRSDRKYDIRGISEREDNVLYEDIMPLLDVNDNADHIWRYALSEMFNNAVEHSEGDIVDAYIETCYLYSKITIVDNGIGIFRKIVDTLKHYGYADPRPEDAVTELYKGKFTSCPERHTGEGIFFSMHIMDRFAIVSDGYTLRCGCSDNPSFESSHLLAYAMRLTKKGTVVVMQLENGTRREVKEVFELYSDIDDGFIKTSIPVFEALQNRDPVARSQARRLYARLASFKEVVFDFDKVDIMGQGFADELFRVFHNMHPEVTLTPINMNEEVRMMYLHAVNNKVVIPDFSGI